MLTRCGIAHSCKLQSNSTSRYLDSFGAHFRLQINTSQVFIPLIFQWVANVEVPLNLSDFCSFNSSKLTSTPIPSLCSAIDGQSWGSQVFCFSSNAS